MTMHNTSITNQNNNLLKPKVDFIFKKLFCNTNNEDILICFLSFVLKQNLIYATLINKNIMDVHIDSDTFMIEFKVTTADSTNLDIIINIKNERNTTVRTEKRIEYLIMEQLLTYEEVEISEGNTRNKNNKDIYVYLLNLDENNIAYKHIEKFIDGSAEYTIPLQEIVGSCYLDLVKPIEDKDIKTALDIWTKFLIAPTYDLIEDINLLEISNIEKSQLEKNIKKALRELDIISNTKENIYLYEEYERDLEEFNKTI